MVSICNQYKNNRIFDILFFIKSSKMLCTLHLQYISFWFSHISKRPVATILNSIGLAAQSTPVYFETTSPLTWVRWNLRQKWNIVYIQLHPLFIVSCTHFSCRSLGSQGSSCKHFPFLSHTEYLYNIQVLSQQLFSTLIQTFAARFGNH